MAFDREKFGSQVNELNQATAEAKANAKKTWFPPCGIEMELLFVGLKVFEPGTYDDGNPAPGQVSAMFQINNDVTDESGASLRGKKFPIRSPLSPNMAWKYTALLVGIFGSKPMSSPPDILDDLEGAEQLVGKRMVIGHLFQGKGTKKDGSPYDPNLQIKDTLTVE